MFKNIQFILHKPQLSENIGACARAMKNFNFSNLVVVNPKPIYPNDKIIATSVGARDIIKKSKYYENLEPVLKNIDCLISTTARSGGVLDKPISALSPSRYVCILNPSFSRAMLKLVRIFLSSSISAIVCFIDIYKNTKLFKFGQFKILMKFSPIFT